MADLKEQKLGLKLLFLLDKSAKEAYQMLQQAFKDDAMSRTQLSSGLSGFNVVS